MTCNQNDTLGSLGGCGSQEKQPGKDFSFNLKQEMPDSGNKDTSSERGNRKAKKKYSVITQQVREQFINKVLSKEATIKQAAKEFGLKFSTSKAILQTYKKEGRIGKKKKRERKPRVVNTVIVATINPLNNNVIPYMALNQVKNDQNQPTLPTISDQLKVSNSLIADACMNQIQRNPIEIGLNQILAANASQDNLNRAAVSNSFQKQQSLMKTQTNLGILNNLSLVELKHQALLNSILQGQMPNTMAATNPIAQQQQQLLALKNRQQLQQCALQQQLQQQLLIQQQQQEQQRQQQQMMLLRNLNMQNQLLMEIDSLQSPIQPTLGTLGLDPSFPSDVFSRASAMQGLLNLNKNPILNPINLQEYRQLGSEPLKRICFGDQHP